MRFYRSLTALLGWTGLVLFFYETTAHKTGPALVHGIIIYFSYFTILSNILVAVCLTFSCSEPRTPMGKLVNGPGLRTSAAVYIIVTGTVYVVFLRALSPPGLVLFIANVLLHYVVPALYVVDWLIFVPKGMLRWNQVLYRLAFPLLYAAYTFIHGALTGFYPYYFINAAKLGYPAVLLNCLYLMVTFVALGSVLTATDRWMGRRKIDRPLQSSTKKLR
ncbi:MAG: Pr6Pr family membrane protein [Desulfomonilaceae bacterium]|nr:Pr6Pr family membrane protein [Desulfomonilaceae bacterium]